MISVSLKSRPAVAASVGPFQKLDLKAVLFVGLICFLIFWSFGGKALERKAYGPPSTDYQGPGDLGAEIVVWQPVNGATALIVGHVFPDSPAQRAGLKPGDQIVGIDGRLVSSMDMAMHIISAKRSGNSLKVTINRNGRKKVIYVRSRNPLTENQSLRKKALQNQDSLLPSQLVGAIVFLKLTIVMFLLTYKNMVNRTLIVLLFAAAFVFLGLFFTIYSPLDAFFAIKFNTISLLLGMGIISIVLGEAGFFDYVAYWVCRFAGKSMVKILILFCLVTYAFSLLVNNLGTILVVVPMTLKLAAIMEFDPRPLIIGEIISSNLGGASTMVGDFPNMLISSEAGIGFNEFLIYMMPICLILLAILLVYLRLRIANFTLPDKEQAMRAQVQSPEFARKRRKALRRAVFVLCHVIFLLVISRRISLNPSAVALFGGLSLFLFSGIDRSTLISRVGFNDILFFIGLFVVVGGLEASGLLQYISDGITFLSGGKTWLLCLILMWSAALLTAFLNAGPTTAMFFPVVLGCNVMPPHHIIWWALSLGVLAGSCATVFGATAGPVSATLVEKFSSSHSMNLSGGNTITYAQFARIGVPVMFLFLSVSSVYITFLCFHL
ncbi:MAG: PDZ domain-containing protein [Deltaproteobacteria bacterium]|nr:PDZ domain-containing protein [Deltaproteobacteria bacterium]